MAFTTTQNGWLNGKPIYHSYATGTGTALAETLAPGKAYQLLRVQIHLNAAATQQTFTVTLDANQGATYDAVEFSQAMSGYADVSNTFGSGYEYIIGDELDFAWTNTDGKTWGLSVVWRTL